MTRENNAGGIDSRLMLVTAPKFNPGVRDMDNNRVTATWADYRRARMDLTYRQARFLWLRATNDGWRAYEVLQHIARGA